VKPKVVLIGDSIRMGYEPLVAKRFEGLAEVLSHEENGGTSENVLKHLDEWAISRNPDVIHLNCGLHDLAIDELGAPNRIKPEAYVANVKEIFKQLRAKTKAKLIWATTTPVVDEWHLKEKQFERRQVDVIKYNELALPLTAGLAVDDLFAVIVAAGIEKCLRTDGVHMTPMANEILADAVTAKIRAALRI
jgi:isoamyl acetate esterase